MRRKTVIATVIAGLAGLVGIAGFAHGHGGWRGHRLDPEKVERMAAAKLEHVLDELDANDAQRTKLTALKDKLVASARGYLDGRRATHDAFLEQLTAEKPDREALHALVDQRLDEIRKLAHEAVDAGVEAHGVLDAKQRARIAEHLSKRLGH